MTVLDDLRLQAALGQALVERPVARAHYEPSNKGRLSGDTYVVATHTTGLSERVRRNFWSLGLWATGDAISIDSSSAARRGQVFQAREDLVVIPTTAAAWAVWSALPWCAEILRGPRPGSRVTDRYEIGGRPAALLRFENGEFLRCESSAEYYSVKWSSALPVRSMLEAVGAGFPVASGEVSGYAMFTDGSHVEGPIDLVALTARNKATRLDVFRVRTQNLVFGWTANLSAHNASKHVALHQCTVVARKAPATFIPLVAATATPAVGEDIRRLSRLLNDLTPGWQDQ